MPSITTGPREAIKQSKTKRSSKSCATAPTTNHLSAEYVEDSDNEDRRPSGENPKTNGGLPDRSSGLNSKSKSSGKESAAAISSTGSESSSESGSDEIDISSSREDERTQFEQIRPIQGQNIGSVPNALPPYEPPQGFEGASIHGPSRASQLFKPKLLEGKQIWYLTAPASVPISAVQEISMTAAREHNVALTYMGNDYGFEPDVAMDRTYTKLLLPSHNDEGFRKSIKSIDQVFHLQRLVRLPTTALATDQPIDSNAHIIAPKEKPIRQQPKGLRMRYHPVGLERTNESEDDPSEGDNEHPVDQERENAPQFRKFNMQHENTISDRDMTGVLPQPKVVNKHARRESKDLLKRKHDQGGIKKSRKDGSSRRETIPLP